MPTCNKQTHAKNVLCVNYLCKVKNSEYMMVYYTWPINLKTNHLILIYNLACIVGQL